MSERKYGIPQDLGSALQGFFRALGKPEQLLLTRLWQHWEVVMGPDLAGLAWPLGQRNGILLVGGEDAMAMQELSLMGDEILERANAFMERPYFTGVKVSLSLGKAALDSAVRIPRPAKPVLEPGPVLSGSYLASMSLDSAAARCYARYVAQKKGAVGITA